MAPDMCAYHEMMDGEPNPDCDQCFPDATIRRAVGRAEAEAEAAAQRRYERARDRGRVR